MENTREKWLQNEQPAISVIIPVFNAEPYIVECIESLKRQKQNGLEFIFIDDCSTDRSMHFVEEWAKEDSRVRIIRNEVNRGAGYTRNRGIEIANGEYYNTIDPDDYVSDDYYEKLYQKAIETNCDIVKGARVKFSSESVLTDEEIQEAARESNRRINRTYQKGNPIFTCFDNQHTTALFRSSLFLDPSVRYGTTKNSEDVLFLLKVCYSAKSIATIDDAYYFYRQCEGSATSVYSFERSYEEFKALSESLDFFREKGITDEAIVYIRGKLKHRLNNYNLALQREQPSSLQQEKMYDLIKKMIDDLNENPILFEGFPELKDFLDR